MAGQASRPSGTLSWDTEEGLLSDLVTGLYNAEGRVPNVLEVPELQPSLPIIRPPEGCENMNPSDIKDLHYQHLPTPTSIRLLKIFPGRESYSEFELFRPPLRCSIIVADLNDKPSYDALSYTWGDPCTLYLSPKEISPQGAWAARPFNIEVDGREISVGANLYAALLALRSHVTHQTDPRFSETPQSTGCFWIDALCINQSNLKEKSSQVMMMSRIYRQACLVFAWLGGGDRLSRQALYDLETIAKLSSSNLRDPGELRKFDITACETYQKLGMPELGYTSWIGIYLLLNRAWFKRAWIVQEVTLAQQPWFMCGRQLGNLEVVLTSLETLQQSRWLDQMRRLAEPLIQNHRNKRDYDSKLALAQSEVRLYRPRETHSLNSQLGGLMRDVRIAVGTFQGWARDGSAPKRPSLLRLLEMYRFTESGDTRDKVYAFVGLSLEQESNPLRVDYELQVEEVFVEAVRHILASKGDLRVLSLKKADLGAVSMLKLPSWVPDFTIQDFAPPLNQSDLFSASKGLESVRLSCLSGNELQLSGAKIDAVRDIAVGFRWADIPDLALLLGKATPPDGQTLFETLWRTLLADQYEAKTPAPRECGHYFLAALEKTVLAMQINAAVALRYEEYLAKFRASSAASMRTPPEGLDQFMVFERTRERLGAMYTAIQRMLHRHADEDGVLFPPEFVEFENRRKECKSKEEEDLVVARFHEESVEKRQSMSAEGDIEFQISGHTGWLLYVTVKGSLGLGPGTLEVGDEVWILAAADVPFLLRPAGSSAEKFTLIGETYVHGAMQGEAVADVREGDVRNVHLV